MSNDCQLTIVMVAGPGDQSVVEKNVRHIAKNNPDANYEIHVLDNGVFHGHPPIALAYPRVQVHEGVALDMDKPKVCRGSYQHSAALNSFLRKTKTPSPYLLILDPDFYIVRPNWINGICAHMGKDGLQFFGAPWHPKWYTKYRYFPCVHCMFVDAKAIDTSSFDFTPDLIQRGIKKEQKKKEAVGVGLTKKWVPTFFYGMQECLNAMSRAYIEEDVPIPRSLKAFTRFVNRCFSLRALITSFTVNRKYVGDSNDTGYLLEKKYRGKTKVETVAPSVCIATDFDVLRFPTRKWRLWLERLVPDRRSYLPNRPGYFTEMTFSSVNLPDVRKLCWEEFFWNNEPFGFHMRRYNKVKRDPEMEEKLLCRALQLDDCS